MRKKFQKFEQQPLLKHTLNTEAKRSFALQKTNTKKNISRTK